MKTLSFTYHLKINFSEPINNHRFTVRCIPLSDDRQEILSKEITVTPNEFISISTDSFGNHTIYGMAENSHQVFEVGLKGQAVTGKSKGVAAAQNHQVGYFKYQSAYTKPGENIKYMFSQLNFSKTFSNLDMGKEIMERLYNYFIYCQGVTDVNTTAEQALTLGKGVCQDYAHIMLSLCRMQGIPSRYIVGMLVGEGASHAWVEVYDKNQWYGLDPTNYTEVFEDHIKISHGRDYNDCMINQGLFVGRALQRQEVFVNVEEIGENYD